MPRWKPVDLAELVEARVALIEPRAFLTSSAHQRLREMWCAARFGVGFANQMGECEIEIAEHDEQREFDFHLWERGARLPFQVAEVLDEGRRRGEEYRVNTPDEVFELHNSRRSQSDLYAARRICEVLKAKHEKRYAGADSLHMLLYLNLKASSVAWASLAAAAESEAKSFASVWLVAQDVFCCIHGGNRWVGLVGWRAVERVA